LTHVSARVGEVQVENAKLSSVSDHLELSGVSPQVLVVLQPVHLKHVTINFTELLIDKFFVSAAAESNLGTVLAHRHRQRQRWQLTLGNGSPMTWQNIDASSPGRRDWIFGVTRTSGSAEIFTKNCG